MNFARVAASVACLTILPIGCAAARPATVSADVNLRTAPGTDSTVVTLIPKGTKVEVGKCDNGWCQVTWNEQTGYAIARNLGLGMRTAARRRPPGGYVPDDDDGYEPVYGPAYYPPPVYYGPYAGPFRGPYWGWGWRGGWGRRW